MKTSSISSLLIITLVLACTSVGCKKKLQRTTPLPTRTAGGIEGPGATGPIGNVDPLNPDGVDTTSLLGDSSEGGTPLPETNRDDWDRDPATFADNVVYFEFDQSNIKPSEVGKIENVAAAFATMSGKALRIEGHCDERGTEEYNRALGERRALSVREYLITLGVDPQLIDTVSFGEDQPVDPNPTEEAWAKNRRGEFIVLTPPSASN